MRNKINNTFIIILGVLAGFLAISLILLCIYRILFKGSDDQATIFSGILSLFGGIAGATAAYLIARMQMTNQIEMQFDKEKQKMKMDLEVKNAQNAVQVLAEIRNEFSNLRVFFKRQKSETIDKNIILIPEKYVEMFIIKLETLFSSINKYPMFALLYEDYDKFMDFHNTKLVVNVNTLDSIQEKLVELGSKIIGDQDTITEINESYNEIFTILNSVKSDIEEEISKYQNTVKKYLRS